MPVTLAKKTSTVSGRRTTKVKPAPDFKKLHNQFLKKIEQGKACTKKPCTVIEEFDLSKAGTKTQVANVRTPGKTPGKKPINCLNGVNKENCLPHVKSTSIKTKKTEDEEFQPNKSALESILDNTGITMDTLYPKPTVRQTISGNSPKTPLQPILRRQTAATENFRRSIYYTGNEIKPSPSQAYSAYSRHVLSLSHQTTKTHTHEQQNVGASPQLKNKIVPYGISPLFKEKPLPRMSLFKCLDHHTPTNNAKRLSPVRSAIKMAKPQRILNPKSPAPSSPSFKVPTSVPMSAKKPGITWKDLLNEDMERLQELEKIEKDLESDIEEMEQLTPLSHKKKKTARANVNSNSVTSNKIASPRTPGQKSRSKIDAWKNVSPLRTPGQTASPKLPPRSPLVCRQNIGSPKRKAEHLAAIKNSSKDPSTPPRCKRPVREKDITPKSTGRISGLKSGMSPFSVNSKGESPIRAILGELSPSVCRGSPKQVEITEYDVEDKENYSPEMLKDAQSMRGDDSFFLVEEDEAESGNDENVNELNRTLNQSIAEMDELEEQANKARRRTEDPDKLMDQLQLIQKRQKELMKMQMDLQEKLSRAEIKKSMAKSTKASSSLGPLKPTHAPTPSKRWMAQQNRDGESTSDGSVELSGSAYSDDSTKREPVTPLRKVLFPTDDQGTADIKKEVHFQDTVEICEITAMDDDMSSRTSDSSIPSSDDVSTGSNDVFESPVEVKIYGKRGEIDQTWKTQASVSLTNQPPIVSTATIPSVTPNKSSIRLGSTQSFTSLKSVLPMLSPLKIKIPEDDCGYPRSDSLLDVLHSYNETNSQQTLTTNTTTLSSLTTPSKSYCHSPRTPRSNRLHYTTSSSLSPCNITMSPLTISATDVNSPGSLSLAGNLSVCSSPLHKPRGLLDQCLLSQAQLRYEEALADDEVSRYMNRLSAMPRAPSPSYRCREPLSKILDEGDDKHFVPVWKPVHESGQEAFFYPIVCPMPAPLSQA